MMGRIPKERMEKALEQLKTISQEDYAKVKGMANIVKTPNDYDLKGWRDLTIPSDDGTPLEAWYIPANGGESNKLIIFNHALPMCRAGDFPGTSASRGATSKRSRSTLSFNTSI